MDLPLWVAIPGGVVLLAIIIYGFRQGSKITTKPQGVPPEETANYTVPRDS